MSLQCCCTPAPNLQIRSIVAKEGVRGLYAGYGAFLLRDLPFDAIEFVAYEQLRKAAAKLLERDPNPVEVSVVGAIAGGFTGTRLLPGPSHLHAAVHCVHRYNTFETCTLLCTTLQYAGTSNCVIQPHTMEQMWRRISTAVQSVDLHRRFRQCSS